MITRARLGLAALGLATLVSGCASVQGPASPADPLESMNRAVWKFNDAVDGAIVKPAAVGYRAVVPEPARNCFSNMLSNVGDLWSAVNSLLQGKPGECANTVLRFTVNSTFGLAGCIDIAGYMPGLDRKREDFGQTLGKWGVGAGPYLVLPFLGPSTARDSVGLTADLWVDPIGRIANVPVRNSTEGMRFISLRSELLDTERILNDAALDRYSFVRDAYLQRRLNLIYDGEPPESKAPSYDDPESLPEASPTPARK